MTVPAARVQVFDPTNTTLIGSLDLAAWDGWTHGPVDATGQDPLNDSCTVDFAVHRSHPFIGELQPRRCVRLVTSDGDVLTVGRLTERTVQLLARQKGDEVADVSCPGLLDDFRGSPIDPWTFGRPNSLERVWNFASPTQDLMAEPWADGTHFRAGAEVDFAKFPEGYPVLFGFVAWVSTAPVLHFAPPWENEPAGDSVIAFDYVLDAETTVVFYAAATRSWDIWLDGTLAANEPTKAEETTGFERTHRYVVRQSAGPHRFVMRARSVGRGLRAMMASAFKVTPGGNLGAAIFTTAPEFDGWRSLHNPTVFPGYPAPAILGELLAEAQERGELPGWSIDAVGTFWPIEEYSRRVGDSMYDVIMDLAASEFDVEVDRVGLVLRLHSKFFGRREDRTSVVFDEGAGLADLAETIDDDTYNAVQVTYAKGVHWRVNAAAVAAAGGERRSKALTLGNERRISAVNRIADAFLAAWAEPTRSLVASVQPGPGKVPGVDFRTGDDITVAGEQVRVTDIGWARNDVDGKLEAALALDTAQGLRVKEQQREIERMLAKYEAPATAPIIDTGTLIPSGIVNVEKLSFSWSGKLNEAVLAAATTGGLWQPERVERRRRLVAFEVEMNEPPGGGGNTILELRVNGVLLDGLYNLVLEEGHRHTRVSIGGYEVVHPGSRISPAAALAGWHTTGRITIYLADPV